MLQDITPTAAYNEIHKKLKRDRVLVIGVATSRDEDKGVCSTTYFTVLYINLAKSNRKLINSAAAVVPNGYKGHLHSTTIFLNSNPILKCRREPYSIYIHTNLLKDISIHVTLMDCQRVAQIQGILP